MIAKQKCNFPTHVAIICDGNRRWAKAHGLQVLEGHTKAATAVFEPLVKTAAEQGVKYLTFWVFSTENWQRSPLEVQGLIQLLRTQLQVWQPRLHEKRVRMLTIGDLTRLPEDIQTAIKQMVELTKDNTAITVVFAMNYGGRDELLRTVRSLATRVAAGELKPTNITAEEVSSSLDTAGIPDPDLIIRTGGEYRLSGFMPWQSVYSEIMVTPLLFPELTGEKLIKLLDEYSHRTRRFGK